MATAIAMASRMAAERPRVRRRDDMITIACATWMMIGLFLDGWAHSNIVIELESFFTPWHAVFYSGFTATATWMGYQALRLQTRGAPLSATRVPLGYGLGVVGVAVFAIGGVGDMVWHMIFGIEADIEALLSPTHMLLFAGSVLILASPWRAAWHSGAPARQSLRRFSPVLASMTLTTAMVAFFFNYLSPFTDFWPTEGYARWVASAGPMSSDLVELSVGVGIASYLWTTMILVTPLLLAFSRWQVPFGTAAVMFTTIAIGLSAMEALDGAEMVLSAVIGGLGTDLAIRYLRPSPTRPVAVRAVAALVPVLLWTTNFATIALFWGIGWTVELWAGTVCICALSALGAAYLSTAPASPAQRDS